MARFEIPNIKRISLCEWLGVCASVAALVSTFLTWTVLSTSNPAVVDALASLPYDATHRSAWDSGIYAWVPMVLTILTGFAVAVFGQFRRLRRAGLPHLWLIAGAVQVALSVIGLFAMRGQFGAQAAALLAQTGVEASAGVGRWLGLAAAVLTLAAAAFDVRALRREPRPAARKVSRR